MQYTHNATDNELELKHQLREGAWVLILARNCEEVWDLRGRAAAKDFVESKVTRTSLKDFLSCGHPSVRRKCLYLISVWNDPDVCEIIGRALHEDSSPIVRHEAAYL